MEVMKGIRSGAIVWKIGEGIGSRGQVVGLVDVISFRTSSGDRGEKEDIQGIPGLFLWGIDALLWGRGGETAPDIIDLLFEEGDKSIGSEGGRLGRGRWFKEGCESGKELPWVRSAGLDFGVVVRGFSSG